MSEQPVRIALQEHCITLGAVLLRQSLVKQAGAQLLPAGVFTKNLLASEVQFVLTCARAAGAGAGSSREVTLVHRMLMLQQ